MTHVETCRKCTKWPQTDLKHLTVKRTLRTLNTYPQEAHIFNQLFNLLLNQPFLRYMVAENWKYAEWPQNNFEHLSVKITFYIRWMPPMPNFSAISFYKKATLFWDNVVEYQKCTEWPQVDLEYLTVKSTLHTLNSYPRVPIFTCFSL